MEFSNYKNIFHLHKDSNDRSEHKHFICKNVNFYNLNLLSSPNNCYKTYKIIINYCCLMYMCSRNEKVQIRSTRIYKKNRRIVFNLESVTILFFNITCQGIITNMIYLDFPYIMIRTCLYMRHQEKVAVTLK